MLVKVFSGFGKKKKVGIITFFFSSMLQSNVTCNSLFIVVVYINKSSLKKIIFQLWFQKYIL